MLKQRNPSSRNPRRRFAAPGISVEYCLFRWSAADNSPSDSVEAFADQAGAVAHFLLGDRERRRDAERRIAVEEPVAQDARLLEELHHTEHLGRRAQFDGQQQAAAPDFHDLRMIRQQRFVEDASAFDVPPCRFPTDIRGPPVPLRSRPDVRRRW